MRRSPYFSNDPQRGQDGSIGMFDSIAKLAEWSAYFDSFESPSESSSDQPYEFLSYVFAACIGFADALT